MRSIRKRGKIGDGRKRRDRDESNERGENERRKRLDR